MDTLDHSPTRAPDATFVTVALPGRNDDSIDAAAYPVILSLNDGDLHASDEMRGKVFLRVNEERTAGQLFISNAHRINHEVLSYEELVRKQRIKVEVRTCTVTEINDLYRNAAAAGTDSDSVRQMRVLSIVRDAAGRGASDVHFYITREITRVRFRIHGRLITQPRHEMSRAEGLLVVGCMYNTMCAEITTQLDESREQDGQLKLEFADKAGMTGSRVATRPAIDRGLLVVLRIMLPDDGKAVTLESLGYLPEQLEQIRYMTTRTHGINIFSGITGAGKSTSLKACVEELAANADQAIHVITLEQPTEYRIKGEAIVQTPVPPGPDGFARGIRNALRLDPDVIMVGELRDGPSALAAVDAGSTGHGVWSTTHTPDAPSILTRLRRLGVDDDFVFDPSMYTGLVNQSLVPVLCGACSTAMDKGKAQISAPLMKRLERLFTPDELAGIRLQGDGCPKCRHLGVTGRTVVAEVITPTAEFMQIFRDRGKLAARQHWVNGGGTTKLQHLLHLVREGTVDPRHGEAVVGPLDLDGVTLGSPARQLEAVA